MSSQSVLPFFWLIREIHASLDELTPETEIPLLSCLSAKRLGLPTQAVRSVSILKESIDARKKEAIVVVYTLIAETDRKPSNSGGYEPWMPDAIASPTRPERLQPDRSRPVIVGAGPCGLFCALALAEAGLPPILLERGRPVADRQRDVSLYWREGSLNPESNVQFGEGGAGTFSDGKLTTRIHDPRCGRVLDTLIACGAPEEIRHRAKPHVGTDRLVPAMVALRERLLRLGTEIRYSTRMESLNLRLGRVCGVHLSDGSEIDTENVVLAIGHSARDTFAELFRQGLSMEAKPFSVGVRIEHPQSAVDEARYGTKRHYKLGPSEYQLFERYPDRTAYTFCMCPGGQVVAAASETDTVVTNGMSNHDRDGVNANSAFVVSVSPLDTGAHPLDGIAFQRQLEQAAFRLGGRANAAPVQRLGDFLSGRASSAAGSLKPSYTGEVRLARLDDALPAYITQRMRDAVPAFERKLRGFSNPDAMLTGFETRTSSPLRMLRGEDLSAIRTPGVFPAGEGAGYAGGIMSAAVDGLRAAEAVLNARGV